MDEGAGSSHERAQLNQWMAQLADGDRSAFAPFFKYLWPKLTAWCTHWTGDRDVAEDMAQKTLQTLLMQAHRFRANGDALRWALTLATWECRTWRRQIARRAGYHVPVPELPLTPEEHSIQTECSNTLHALLEQLSPHDRQIIREVLNDQSEHWSNRLRKQKQRAIQRLQRLWRTHGHTHYTPDA